LPLLKLGIIKKNIPTIISNQSPIVKRILDAKCVSKNSTVIWSAERFTVSRSRKSIIQKLNKKSIEYPFPNLIGTHQISNAMTAISTLTYLKVPEKHICEGLTSTYWPARLQEINNGDLYELIKSFNINNKLWIDGGHNEGASIQLSKSVGFMNKKNLHIIFGSLNNKDHRSFLRNLVAVASSLSIVEIDNQPSSLIKTVAVSSAKEVGWQQVYPAHSIRDAIKNICSQENVLTSQVSILICGSLYLAGQALRENGVEI